MRPIFHIVFSQRVEAFCSFRVNRMWMGMGAIGKPFAKCILLPNFTCAVFISSNFFSRRSAIAISNDHSCCYCCHCHWGWIVVNNNLWLWHLIWNWENMLIEMDGIGERLFKIQNTFSMFHSHCKTKTIYWKRLPKVRLESMSESVREWGMGSTMAENEWIETVFWLVQHKWPAKHNKLVYCERTMVVHSTYATIPFHWISNVARKKNIMYMVHFWSNGPSRMA